MTASSPCLQATFNLFMNEILIYSDTSANEDNSFRNHIR